MKYIIFFISFFINGMAFSQNKIAGIVMDQLTHEPISGASVYFANTHTGTTTDNKGKFSLTLPQDRLLLIVSRISYEIVSKDINAIDKKDSVIIIEMTLKVSELDNIIINSTKYNVVKGRNWKNTFRNYFIGIGDNSNKCEIENFEKIVLKLSQNGQMLRAGSDETIVITNRWLGYRIYFDMDEFEINIENNSFVNYGYARFEDIGNDRKIFNDRRSKIYYGSLMHFTRSLYNNTHLEQGFEVRRAQVTSNAERLRIVTLIQEKKFTIDFLSKTIGNTNTSLDSAKYYYQVYVKQKDKIITIHSDLLTSDSLFITNLEAFQELYFKDFLLVTYKNFTSEQSRVIPDIAGLDTNKEYPNSLLSLAGDNSILVFPHGSIAPPKTLIAQGYFANEASIMYLLPFDYEAIPYSHPDLK